MQNPSDNKKGAISFMDAFIVKKIEDFFEPERKGLKRGQPIGIVKEKYTGALLCLKERETTVKELARINKTPYDQFRIWRTETAFKRTTQDLATEFINLIPFHINSRIAKQAELTRQYLNISLRQMVDEPPTILAWSEFCDIEYFSDLVMALFSDLLISELEHSKDLEMIQEYESIFRIMIEKHPSFKELKKVKDFVPRVIEFKEKKISKIPQEDYRDMIFLLAQENLTQTDKKRLMWSLHRSKGRVQLVDMDVKIDELIKAPKSNG